MTRFTQLVRLEVVDSTNRYAATKARAGAKEGLVVVADEQTEGRGRLGRSWVAPKGTALLCSLLFRPSFAMSEVHLVPMIVALSAAQASEELSGCRVGLKWPNDLVIDDRKLGGLLSETVADADADTELAPAVVVGIGINLSVSEALAELVEVSSDADSSPIIGLEELAGRQVGRDALLAALLSGTEARYAALGAGREATIDEYRERCTTLGRRVRVSTAEGEVRGRAVAVRNDGRLEVEDSDGNQIVFEAADVVHLRGD